MNHALDNSLTIGATALYDALTEEPTLEEEQAMDEMERARKGREYMAALKTVSDATAPMLVEQSIEAIAHARDLKDGFTPIWFDAVNGRDEKLIGKLFLHSLDLYRHSIAAAEVGVS